MKLSARDTVLIIAAGLVALVGGLYWFYVKPARKDLSTAQNEARDNQSRVDALQTQIDALMGKSKEPGHTLADELRLSKALPSRPEIPETILQLQRLAQGSHVELGSIKPGDSTDYAGVTGTPLQVSVTGRFLDVQDFMYTLHRKVAVDPVKGKVRVGGRLMTITQASLTSNGTSSTAAATTKTISDKDLVTANINLVAFSRTAAGAGSTTQTAGTTTGGTAR
ncbi:MAG TPA: type 4a pilus biogenesis protein PilO [Miltoncostaeaceae bacterium]|nr:type 4a pilus biogenesis protein PilO [Miltoncostaeaceae bacterium]